MKSANHLRQCSAASAVSRLNLLCEGIGGIASPEWESLFLIASICMHHGRWLPSVPESLTDGRDAMGGGGAYGERCGPQVGPVGFVGSAPAGGCNTQEERLVCELPAIISTGCHDPTPQTRSWVEPLARVQGDRYCREKRFCRRQNLFSNYNFSGHQWNRASCHKPTMVPNLNGLPGSALLPSPEKIFTYSAHRYTQCQRRTLQQCLVL